MTFLEHDFWNSLGAVALIGGLVSLAGQVLTLLGTWRNGKKVDALSTKTDVQTTVLTGKADEHAREIGEVAGVVNGQQTALRTEIAQLKAELLKRPAAPE